MKNVERILISRRVRRARAGRDVSRVVAGHIRNHEREYLCFTYGREASALDQPNQRSLIATAQDFGYALIFASPAPLVTARYCVPITSRDGYNDISHKSWQILEPLVDIGIPGNSAQTTAPVGDGQAPI